jgi:glycosyltransferase involved in cell wall biosynthesis
LRRRLYSKKEDRSMTKVAFVAFEDMSIVRGTPVRIHRVSEILKLNKNYNITLISRSKTAEVKGMENVRLINVKGTGARLIAAKETAFIVKLLFVFLWNLKLALVLLRNKFDIVYCVTEWLGFPGIYLISKVKKYKIVFDAHGIWSKDDIEAGLPDIRIKLDQSFEKFVIKHSDFVIATSEDVVEFYQAYNSQIDLVAGFVDTDIFRAESRIERTNTKLIGLIGPFDSLRTRQQHSLDFLYAKIGQFDSKIRFVVIGRCDKRIDNARITYTEYLESPADYVAQLSRLDAVLVVEGVANFAPLTRIYESMSCSLPVFTTPKGMVGTRHVKPGENILVFDEEELVEKVNTLIFDDKLMTEIGANARKTAEQYWSKKANEERLLKIMDSVSKKDL